jgi:restriction system protein
MAEVTIQRQGELGRKLFEILVVHPEGMCAQDALQQLRSQIELTAHENGGYESGSLRFDKIVRLATIDYVKAGWMIKAMGQWSVTATGIEAYAKYQSPEIFHRNAAKVYQEWRASRPDAETTVSSDEEDATEMVAAITFEQAEEQAWGEIEQYLKGMNPYEFQKLFAGLLRAMGYHVSWVAPPGKDGGIDILAWNDPLGTRPPRIKVQVKREKNAIKVGDLRSFMALLGDDDVGIFVNVGGFTKDTEEEARTQQNRKIILVALDRLYELWVEHYSELDQEARDRLPLKPIYFLAPET